MQFSTFLLACNIIMYQYISYAFKNGLTPTNGYLESLEKRRDTNPYLDGLEKLSKNRPTIMLRPKYREMQRKEPREEFDENIVIPAQFPGKIFRIFLNNTRSVKTEAKLDKTSESGLFRMEHVNRSVHNFTSVGGYEDVKQQLLQILDFINIPEKYTQYGVRIPKGIMLEGPTGNGKTLLARCFAGEAGMNFISTSGSEFTEKYVGVGASRVRELFQFSSQNKPCIIFIDEIDALGRSRSDEAEASGAERDQTLNQLLVMLDGFTNLENNLIIGATNRIDILDKALLRPGRFDKIINVPNPDASTRKQILEIHRRKKPIDVPIDYMVRLCNGFNGAQIENLLNEAVLHGIRTDKLPVVKETIELVREKILMGQSTLQNVNISDSLLRRVAIHEVGHLLLSLQSEYFDKPWKVTINSVNPTHSLGYTIFDNDDDTRLFVRQYFFDRIKVLLGGRIAEEIYYKESTSSGASSDLDSALSVARKMVIEYGMGRERVNHALSETYKARIDEQVDDIIRSAGEETMEYLIHHRELIDRFVDELLVKKSLYRDEIMDIYVKN